MFRGTSPACLAATFVIAAGATLAAIPAIAETHNPGSDIPDTSPFGQYLASTLHSQYRQEMASRENKGVGRQCLSDVAVNDWDATIINPVTMEANNRFPTAGMWVERYTASACGRTRTFNVLFEMKDGGGMIVSPVVPGTSDRAFDMLQSLRPSIEQNVVMEACDTASVLDTRPGVPDGYQAAVDGGDYDTWRLIGCGQQFDLVLLFERADDGTIGISIETQITVPPANQPATPE